MEIFFTTETWVSLAALTALEIVLGIDNIVFITILAGKLPEEQQSKARKVGLSLALLTRLALLSAISWVMGLSKPLFALLSHEFNGRDVILLAGGLFLIAKSTLEIFEKLEVEAGHERAAVSAGAFGTVIVQIMMLDIVFSLDSVITAVGMVKHLSIMMTAVVVAVAVMLVFSDAVSRFIEQHPSLKILALSFLLMIGVLLVAEGLGQHLNKGYVYFAMAFSLAVELVNIRVRKAQRAPVRLHRRFETEDAVADYGAPSGA